MKSNDVFNAGGGYIVAVLINSLKISTTQAERIKDYINRVSSEIKKPPFQGGFFISEVLIAYTLPTAPASGFQQERDRLVPVAPAAAYAP